MKWTKNVIQDQRVGKSYIGESYRVCLQRSFRIVLNKEVEE